MRRFALIAFTVALSWPASADSWMDKNCGFGVVTEKGALRYLGVNDAEPVSCELAGNVMTCADGSTRTLVTLASGDKTLDGVELFKVGPENPSICD